MKIIYTLLVFSVFISCNGQKPVQKTEEEIKLSIGEKVNQLSKSSILIFQASNGDFWFGSDIDGVYKYDGKTFIHLSTQDGLLDNRIRNIQEDKNGNIYFTTLSGINKFDGQLITSLIPIRENNWKLNADDLWFNMSGIYNSKGPLRYDGINLYLLEFPKHYLEEEFYKNHPNISYSPYDVYYSYKDKKGNMWFGTSNFGLCRYDGKTINWLYEDHLTNVPGGGSFGIRSILEDQKGKFWICNTRYRFTIYKDSILENEKVFIHYKKETGIENISANEGTDPIYFMSAIEDQEGNLWMLTYDQGVYKYDGQNLKKYTIENNGKTVKLYSIYQDRQHKIWVGTHDNGVYQYNGNDFEKFEPQN